MANEVERWEPFKEMMSLRDAMNRLFEDSFIRPGGWPLPFDAEAWSVPVDVIETKDRSSSRRRCRASSRKTSTCR